MIVEVNGVESKFVAVYIAVMQKKFRFTSHNNKYKFADQNDADLLVRNYTQFKLSGKNMDDWFDREVILCRRLKSSSTVFTTSIKKVNRTPVFIGHRGLKAYYVLKLDELYAKFPIQMTLSQLTRLNGIFARFQDLEDLYSDHDINFRFLEIKKGRAFDSECLPGQRQGNFKTILVGNAGDKWFWMPPTFVITERYKCDKFPGKCTYWTYDQRNLNRHKESCVAETKVISDQISYGVTKNMMQELVEQGLLPQTLRNYRHTWLATFDIETLEKKMSKDLTSKLKLDAHQYIVSIGVSTNLPERADKFFVRKVKKYTFKLIILSLLLLRMVFDWSKIS